MTEPKSKAALNPELFMFLEQFLNANVLLCNEEKGPCGCCDTRSYKGSLAIKMGRAAAEKEGLRAAGGELRSQGVVTQVILKPKLVWVSAGLCECVS